MQGHVVHTCLAASIWSIANPVVPIGKNNDGSVSLHAAFKRQSWSLGSYFGIVSANGPPK